MRCRSSSTIVCSTYRGSRGSGSAAARASTRPSWRSTWCSKSAPPSDEIGSASKTARTLRAPANGNPTCTATMRSTLWAIFRTFPGGQRLLSGQPARRQHVHASPVLPGAHVEDEPQIVGEQALLALEQAANEPGNLGGP